MTLRALRTISFALGFLTASMFSASAATIFNFSANVIEVGGSFTSTLAGTVSIDTSTGIPDQWNITSPDFTAWTGTPLLTLDPDPMTSLSGDNSILETLVVSFFPLDNFIGLTGVGGGNGFISPFFLSQHCLVFTCAVRDATLSLSAVPTVPLPAALPLFATALGALGLLSWRGKRKAQAA